MSKLFPQKFIRNEESYTRHMVKVVSVCRQRWGKFDYIEQQERLFDKYVLKKISCQSNYCGHCRTSNIFKLKRVLEDTIRKENETWRFLTLTYDPKKMNVTEQIKNSSKQWTRLIRLSRELNQAEFKFIRKLELQTCGNIHIHAIINKYISTDWIAKTWQELGGGSIDITLNPKCKIHSRKCCSDCYPAQWKWKENCIVHGVKECRVCNPFLLECPIHRKIKCKDCYPEHYFDRSRYAASYLVGELANSKQHQDPFRSGLAWWLAGKRTLAYSKNIKLNQEKSKYQFDSIVGNNQDLVEYVKFFQKDNNARFQFDGKNIIYDTSVEENIDIDDGELRSKLFKTNEIVNKIIDNEMTQKNTNSTIASNYDL